MSDMNDAFWHKGQRNMVGSRCFSKGTLAMHASTKNDVKTTTAIGYSIANTGGIYSKAGTAQIDISALGGVHENNPKIEYHDDSQPTARLTRQSAVGLSLADDEHVYILFTLDASGTVRVYAGEMVGITSTAKRPQLDLTAEACFGQLYLKNETGSAFVFGSANLDLSTGDGVTATFTDLSFPPSD